jgi:hypothetical protein
MFVRDTRAAVGVATASHFSMESGCVGVPGGSPRRDGRERRPCSSASAHVNGATSPGVAEPARGST